MPHDFAPSALARGIAALVSLLALLPVKPALAQALPEPERLALPPVRDEAAVGPVEAITFDGATVLTDDELQAIARPWLRRPLTAADLEELRLAVTRRLVERGYVNSGALIPDGAWRDGRLRLVIVEGRLTGVQVKGQGRLREGYIAERLGAGSGDPFNVQALQDRFQRLLADPLIARMNARIVPGAALGEATLDVDVTRAQPYKLALLANNHRTPSVGEAGGGLTGTVWNLSGLGDALDATVIGSEGSERLNIGWSVPLPAIGPFVGTVFTLRHDRGDTSVVEEPIASIDIVSRVKSLDIGLGHALIDTLAQRVALGLTWSQRESRTTLLGEPFSFTPGEPDGLSRLHAWRFMQEFVQRDATQTLALRSTFSWGRNNIMDGLDPALAAPSKRYAFWLGQAQFARRLADVPGAQLVLKASLQKSRDRLLPLERLAVGGVATVRGYRENQLVRDEGITASVELHWPLLDAAESDRRVTLIPFVDAGRARNRGEASDDLGSIGLALDARFGPLGVELAAAKRLKTPAVATRGALQDRGVHLQLRYELF
ncbi:ShlB/FhaC/HecB family hemolysin secretion/activation protein [Aquabacterium humicola]|uniref:ShlB/FhaC/HecB family hemolysin secretion/activation protein n=1 Tax=Aquabacterium humicola TaxID=3237377 RepID=UPI0025431E2C|nr:ShlB/FhaC/HecB family hemolysin secretion/activation protein [Rubrivivax pictus]